MRLPTILVLLLFLAGYSFGQKKPTASNKVEVGMTFDQVRKEMGNPTAEDKGFTEVQDYSIVILAQQRILSWLYPLFRKDTLFEVVPRYRKAPYQRPVHNYSINDMPVTDDEFKSIVTDSEGVVTFRNPLTNDTTEIDSVIWKAYARSFRHGPELTALVESGDAIIKKDSLSYVPDIRDEPIPGSFRRLRKAIVLSMYAVLFDAASGRVAEKGYYPYQVERLPEEGSGR